MLYIELTRLGTCAALVSVGRVALTELNHAFDLMLKGEVKRSVVVYG